ncbi:hypothetical protein SAMN04488134_1139 [Amphibacillus marinus]|uniref:Tetratricopeptide repeat-containing protein n=1 Tax=Amphibacillus marinus TaxID=872970 RepID=A0A1H8SJK4_9BACI|nr:DUF3196 family protein [Amphibacillus marinus]SEO78862.1 hypothetical protein SAMN04488134_1139 [Amphibacillus marinus]
MDQQHKNVVLFPKQRKELEQQAEQALHRKQFVEALKIFEQLIDYGITERDISMGKLTCLIELGRHRDAEDLCEELIAREDDDYFSYINIYATLLFQFHKHKEVGQLLEEVLGNEQIPEQLHNQLKKLFEVNQPLVDEQLEREMLVTKRELEEALDNQDTMAQWHLVNHLQRMNLAPYFTLFEKMLINEAVHPVVKTVIVGLLQAQSIDRLFKVGKFNQQRTINPIQIPFMNDHPFQLELKKRLSSIEDNDPSFYRFSNQLIDRFFYVNYPMVPSMDEVDILKDAIVALVKASYHSNQQQADHLSSEVKDRMNQILECEQIYFSLMEE